MAEVKVWLMVEVTEDGDQHDDLLDLPVLLCRGPFANFAELWATVRPALAAGPILPSRAAAVAAELRQGLTVWYGRKV